MTTKTPPGRVPGRPTSEACRQLRHLLTLDAATGKIARVGGGAIGDGATVKVTYNAAPQIILTHRDNLIVAFGRDITMERDREIYRRVTQFAITVACDVQVQNPDAIVKVINIGLG